MNIVTGVLNVWNQFKESLMQNFALFRSNENGTSEIFALTFIFHLNFNHGKNCDISTFFGNSESGNIMR